MMPVKKTRRRKKDFLDWLLPAVLAAAILALVALFWGNVSWIVNADVWRQNLSDAFPQWFPRPYVMAARKPVIISGTPEIDNEPEIKSAGEQAEAPQSSSSSSASAASPATAAAEAKPRRDMVTIPKINITAPIITAQTDNNDVIHGLLDSGVVLYPGSAPFGKTGQTVLLGHSAPAGWPKIKYDWVFSKLNELAKGDMIVITYNNETRYYRVVKTRVVTPQEGLPESTVEGNSLMLVSCWPPGKDLKRIAVETTIMDD